MTTRPARRAADDYDDPLRYLLSPFVIFALSILLRLIVYTDPIPYVMGQARRCNCLTCFDVEPLDHSDRLCEVFRPIRRPSRKEDRLPCGL